MEQDKLIYFRSLLQGEKRRILDNLSSLEEAEEIGSLKDTLQELSLYASSSNFIHDSRNCSFNTLF